MALRAALGLLLGLSATPRAQDAGPFLRGETAPNVHHTGTVWLHGVVGPNDGAGFTVTQATFAAGARLDWHVHPGGQTLLVTAGEGYYQEDGGPARTLREGDAVTCRPGTAHWHAAAPDRGVTYLAITNPGATVWGEPVSDEVYALGHTADEQELLALSRAKWRWMADRDVGALADLFHPEAVFVHMGGTWGTERELESIESGGIHYRRAEIEAASVRFVGGTAVVLNTIRLDAVVGGNEVTNPFEVTEVYVREGDGWTLASLSFTRLLE